MPSNLSPTLIGVLAGIVVALAGVGAYLQTSLGGPGTTAFDVRLLLVSLAFVGALLLGLAARTHSGGTKAA
ncbi:MAG: hypothetical protein WB778_07025 [Thermoplasmata archaeon]